MEATLASLAALPEPLAPAEAEFSFVVAVLTVVQVVAVWQVL